MLEAADAQILDLRFHLDLYLLYDYVLNALTLILPVGVLYVGVREPARVVQLQGRRVVVYQVSLQFKVTQVIRSVKVIQIKCNNCTDNIYLSWLELIIHWQINGKLPKNNAQILLPVHVLNIFNLIFFKNRHFKQRIF